jgi:hypothetical protein
MEKLGHPEDLIHVENYNPFLISYIGKWFVNTGNTTLE